MRNLEAIENLTIRNADAEGPLAIASGMSSSPAEPLAMQLPPSEWVALARTLTEVVPVTMDIQIPAIVNDFISAIGDSSGLVGVIADKTDAEDEVHLTTFVESLAPSVAPNMRSSVYAAERALIAAYPGRIFSFHLREAEKDEKGAPVMPTAPYALLLWNRPE